ncbi:MAG: PH domain-containing protein [Leptolyngbya sp. SIO1E4]|nr:PH domain-containing protein [Leptolyngbya sp. SIO1E4]
MPWEDTYYELTNQGLKRITGILNREKDEIELYRIKDTRLEEPFLLRMLGLGNVKVVSSNRFMKHLLLKAIENAEGVQENS